MQKLRETIRQLGCSDVPVLLTGPSGTGKELAARAIHDLSRRAGAPFIAVNCAALEPTLLASQLFGHVRGAFTGAHEDTLGFFRAADGGTILLDEIGDMAPALQATLLRVLEGGEVTPVGAAEPYRVDVRVMAATNTNLERLVAKGRFRQDLFFRLNVVRVDLPPLAARREDIPLLLDYYNRRFACRFGQPVKHFTEGALAALRGYDWPGNVRELANVVQALYALRTPRTVDVVDLPVRLDGRSAGKASPADLPTFETAQRDLIEKAMRASGGVKSRAAAQLGIPRQRLLRLLRRYGLN